MSDNDKPDTASELVRRGWRARAEGDHDEARKHMVKAIALYRQADDHGGLANALGKLGHIEIDTGHWDEACAIFEEGIRICREAGDPFGMAHKIRHLAMVHRHAGREDDARAYFLESLSIYKSHDDPPIGDYANAILPVAEIKEQLGQVEEAIELFEEAGELYAAAGVQVGVDDCTNRISRLRQ